jgi:cell division protein FtsB
MAPLPKPSPADGARSVTRLTRPGWIVVGALLILAVMAIFGDNGLLALRRLRGEVDTLVRDVRALEAENERLSRAIAELQEDPAVIERIAREELGLVRPGERVLRFPRSARPGDPTPALPPAGPRSP